MVYSAGVDMQRLRASLKRLREQSQEMQASCARTLKSARQLVDASRRLIRKDPPG